MTKPITLSRRQLRVVMAALALAAEWENSAADCELTGFRIGDDRRRTGRQHLRNEKVYLGLRNELARKLKEDG